MSKNDQVAKTERQEVEASKALIPLKHIVFRGAVNGAFARVKCAQEFLNDAQNPVEAVYIFPLPDDASIVGCKMVIGGRKIEAVLKKKEEAKMEYHEAVSSGHHGALLEQKRANIFEMNVGGIEPGKSIAVEVDYVQRIPWQAGGGRFSIPLVVAPRFIPGNPTGKQGKGFSPDTDEVPDASTITPVVAVEGVPYDAEISLLFSPGFDCLLSCLSHDGIVRAQTVGKTETLEVKTGKLRPDRDFILSYGSLSPLPEMATHKGSFNGEEFLLASIIPPGNAPVAPADVLMVLDCSGSMKGPKIDGLKVIAKKIAGNLRKQSVGNQVGILPFDTRPWPPLPISAISEQTENFIDTLEARGQTELGPALNAAYALLSRRESGQPKVILLITDGETESWRCAIDKKVRIISIGIDTAVNDTVIKGLSAQTNGTYEFVFPGEDYDAVANRITGYLSGPVLQKVKAESEAGDITGVCDVFTGRPATIAVRLKDAGSELTVTGKNPEGDALLWRTNQALAKECDFAAQIWARDFIRQTPDMALQTDTSLRYGVICQHTSFVAISLKEVPGKTPERVEIPVNLPAGWDYEAVFGGANMRRLSLGFATCPAVALDDVEILECLGKPNVYIDDFELGPEPKAQAAISPTNRFALDATDIVDRLIAVLIAIGTDRAAAIKAFLAISMELTEEKASQLTEEKRAMAYYFSGRLRFYGLALPPSTKAAIRKSTLTDEAATVWYELGRKEEGLSFSKDLFALISSPVDGIDYLAWKYGRAEKPTTGNWSLVP